MALRVHLKLERPEGQALKGPLMADFKTRGCFHLFIFKLHWLKELISPNLKAPDGPTPSKDSFFSLKAQLLFSFSQVQIH